jgi:hypothetical protein
MTRGRCKSRKWQSLEKLGVMVAEVKADALDFFLEGIAPNGVFPMNRQWIAATNKLANDVNGDVQAWRKAGVLHHWEFVGPVPN